METLKVFLNWDFLKFSLKGVLWVSMLGFVVPTIFLITVDKFPNYYIGICAGVIAGMFMGYYAGKLN